MNAFSEVLRACLANGLIAGLTLLLIDGAPAWAHPPALPPTKVDLGAEAMIHTPPGFSAAGKPGGYRGQHPARLQVRILDHASGQPTFCRVNVVGSDGNFYEPVDNRLAPYSLHRLANRPGKGPFRYYGWFFYTAGAFEVDVPPGPTRVEVWKGYEYHPQTQTVTATADTVCRVKLELRRTAAMADEGYYSGDTHIHLSRCDADDEARALDLMAAEDMQFGMLLSHNDGRTYSGSMERQLHPQDRGFGPSSVVERGPYAIASGQEYVCSSYGHICLYLHNRLVLEGRTVDPNRWPLLGLLGEETRKLGGYSIHAHGGYANEIYADFPQRVTDGVELLQFAEYRGVALEGWYRMLNVGYRFPAVGACDYPYCRALGDCRTYVFSPKRPTMAEWVRRVAEGRSFFTTGPLLILELDDHRPGDVLRRSGGDAHPLRARVRVRSEVTPVTHVELVVGGRSAVCRPIPAGQAGWFEFEHLLAVREPTWVAARAWSASPPGRPDAEAHTNPIYVAIDGKLPYAEADLDWLLARLDQRIAELQSRRFAEKPAALEFFGKSRRALVEVRKAHGQKLADGWRQTDESLALLHDGEIVWQFNYRKEEGKPYFHPVTIGGETLTDLRPADHPWHRAIWFSWKTINGLLYQSPYTLPARESIKLVYRVLIQARPVDPRAVDAQWRNFAP